VRIEQGPHHREVGIETVVIRQRDRRRGSTRKYRRVDATSVASPRTNALEPALPAPAASPPDPAPVIVLPAAPAAPLEPDRFPAVLPTPD